MKPWDFAGIQMRPNFSTEPDKTKDEHKLFTGSFVYWNNNPTTFKTDIRHEWIPFSLPATTLRGAVALQKQSDKFRLIFGRKKRQRRETAGLSKRASLNRWQHRELRSFTHAHAFWSTDLLLHTHLALHLVGTSVHFPICYTSAQVLTFPWGASFHNYTICLLQSLIK